MDPPDGEEWHGLRPFSKLGEKRWVDGDRGSASVTVFTFWPHCVEDSRLSGDGDHTRRSRRVSFMRSTALAKGSEKPPFSATHGTQPLFARCKLETEMEPQ
jgi:hypothetical protein